MNTIILAGGFGTRISEESHLKPKPMVEVGEKPLLWHIMKIYSHYGFHDFIICCGYKGYAIKEYFADYYLHNSDVAFDFRDGGRCDILTNAAEPWKVTLVDTGLGTMTGGRLKRVQKYAGGEPFMLTYGDGVSDIDLRELLKFHESHGKIATMTAINVGQRFGVLEIGKDGSISAFREKSDSDGSIINGGFMIFNPEIFDYLAGDGTVLERDPLMALAERGQLMAYRHEGYWKCMDTQRDRLQLEELWKGGDAPWKVWN
ncbi:MAG: glucose-1-phosphate cytidylyltransferase [Clostridiales bacterium]|jgi:glucose-1-phosphate cytidylyltransferase|nr:glucose-1-phosphate cytidylyltransferase [Clostridiales bacterium]